MKFNRHISSGPQWNDPDNMPEERCNLIDEQIAARARRKTLRECRLPEGFTLLTLEPKQFWIEKQLTWGFSISFKDFWYVARYDWRIADEIQMTWALDEFRRELDEVGKIQPRRAA